MIQIISFISGISMPLVILLIIFYGVMEKNKVFDDFVEGAKEGLGMVVSIFPTLIGLFIAIGTLRSSGILDIITNLLMPLLSAVEFPSEVFSLALLRPISGSGSIVIATDIMKNYGVDSFLGIVASTIMGSTETTLYTIAVYTSCIKIKKTRFVLAASLVADVVGIAVSVVICRFLS